MLKITKPTVMNLETLRLALGLVGIGIEDKKVLSKIWIVMETLRKKGADMNLRDAVDIEYFVDKKYTPKTITFKDKSKDETKNETNAQSNAGGTGVTPDPDPA